MFTRVYLCLPLFAHVCLHMFTHVSRLYLCLHFFTYVIVFDYVNTIVLVLVRLFVCLFLVLVLVPSLVKNCPTRWDSLFLVICRLLEGTIIRVGVGKLERGSMEALIFHRNITKTFAL